MDYQEEICHQDSGVSSEVEEEGDHLHEPVLYNPNILDITEV